MDIANKYGFEPHIAFIFPSERAVYMFPTIIYDRDIQGEDGRAMACHDEMLQAMIAEGYFPYRLGIQSMQALPKPVDGHDKLVAQIKNLLDPNHILSPGHYHFDADIETIDNLDRFRKGHADAEGDAHQTAETAN
jgi:4-cresol dehydrogenase (hydroxylating)